MPMTYTTLTGSKDTEGSIKYFVRHSEVPVDFVLESAQDAIYQVLRVREMLKRASGTIATDATSLALPTDILQPEVLLRTGSYKGRIILLDPEHFESRVGEDENGELYPGVPSFATYDQSNFYFDAKADQDYPYRLWYMQKPALLSASNESNFLCTRYPNILVAMCKHYAFAHRQNEGQAASELETAMAYITKANEEYDMFKQSIQTEMYWSREG